MSSQPEQRAVEVASKAKDLDWAQRQRFLEQTCSGNQELRRQVDLLLARINHLPFVICVLRDKIIKHSR